jgi:sec-independent protein translocase protein TatC
MKSDFPDDDDFFKETRMSFGDHIEDLRSHLLRAIMGVLVIMIGGFILDGIGFALGLDWLGIGRPMFYVIRDPVESQMQEFYTKRAWKTISETLPPLPPDPRRIRPAPTPEEFEILDKALKDEKDRREVAEKEYMESRRKLFAGKLPATEVNKPREILINIDAETLREALADPNTKMVPVRITIQPLDLAFKLLDSTQLLGKRLSLATLSAQEALVVYVKVALVCSLVLGCPWVFYHVWSFIAAGLYPTERQVVYRSIGPASALFISGAVMCQFIVMPRAVDALLSFNNLLDLDPELRLNDWLGFALMLPLVFGLSFQTPLVMVVLAKIGIFTWRTYLDKWRHALFILAIFAAIITPTPDPFTMSLLLGPMFGLYLAGIWLCRYYVGEATEDADSLDDTHVAV